MLYKHMVIHLHFPKGHITKEIGNLPCEIVVRKTHYVYLAQLTQAIWNPTSEVKREPSNWKILQLNLEHGQKGCCPQDPM